MCDVLASRGIAANSVIVADDDNLELADEFGFDTLDFPNDIGLGARFNAGFQYALDRGADYVVHIGSDDWVHPDFFDALPLEVAPLGGPLFPEPGQKVTIRPRTSVPILACTGMSLINLPTAEGLYFPMRRTWGTIPWAIPRAAFDGIPEPIAPAENKGMEWLLIQGLGTAQYFHVGTHRMLGVDWKSQTNITPWEGLKNSGEPFPDVWDALAEHYPDELVELAVKTSEESKRGCIR